MEKKGGESTSPLSFNTPTIPHLLRHMPLNKMHEHICTKKFNLPVIKCFPIPPPAGCWTYCCRLRKESDGVEGWEEWSQRWMDEMVLEGDINGKADKGRKKDPSSGAVTAHRMTAQFVYVICVLPYVCARVQFVCGCRWIGDTKAQPPPPARFINITAVDTANCNMS